MVLLTFISLSCSLNDVVIFTWLTSGFHLGQGEITVFSPWGSYSVCSIICLFFQTVFKKHSNNIPKGFLEVFPFAQSWFPCFRSWRDGPGVINVVWCLCQGGTPGKYGAGAPGTSCLPKARQLHCKGNTLPSGSSALQPLF